MRLNGISGISHFNTMNLRKNNTSQPKTVTPTIQYGSNLSFGEIDFKNSDFSYSKEVMGRLKEGPLYDKSYEFFKDLHSITGIIPTYLVVFSNGNMLLKDKNFGCMLASTELLGRQGVDVDDATIVDNMAEFKSVVQAAVEDQGFYRDMLELFKDSNLSLSGGELEDYDRLKNRRTCADNCMKLFRRIKQEVTGLDISVKISNYKSYSFKYPCISLYDKRDGSYLTSFKPGDSDIDKAIDECIIALNRNKSGETFISELAGIPDKHPIDSNAQ